MNIRLGLVLAASLTAQDKITLLGGQLAEQVRQQSKPVDEDIQQYVRQVAARVAPGSNWTVETIVKDTDSPYDMFADWAPGYVFVPIRVLSLARNEAELAGVLAHAMSHRPAQSGLGLMIYGEGANRPEELRADREAVAKLAAAGYSPHAYLDYVERVAPRPDPQRIAALQAAVAAVPARPEWIENTSAFAEAQTRARAFEPPQLPRSRPSLQKKIR